MAEPVSSLPVSSPVNDPAARQKAEPIPWPANVSGTQSSDLAASRQVHVPLEPEKHDSSEIVNEAIDRSREALESTWDSVRRTSSGISSKTASKWRQLVSERPMAVILGVAIAGFLAGAALRIWRSRYE